MGALLLALMPLLKGITEPITAYFTTKAQIATATQQLELGRINAQVQMLQTNDNLEQVLTVAKLNATTQEFKQHTFYFLVIPVLLTLIAPNYAKIMWANFDLIPVWFRELFATIYLTIWGVPVALNNISTLFTSMTGYLDGRNDRQVAVVQAKAQALNEAVLADSLRKTIFKAGMTQDQWNAITSSINLASQPESTTTVNVNPGTQS